MYFFFVIIAAKVSAMTALFLAITLCGISSYIFYSLRDLVGYVFTSDPEIIHRCSEMAGIFALLQFINGIQGASQGVMRGMSRQKELFGYTFFSYWLFGLPLGMSQLQCVNL
jgi:MATE family multidrug resistance protein